MSLKNTFFRLKLLDLKLPLDRYDQIYFLHV